MPDVLTVFRAIVVDDDGDWRFLAYSTTAEGGRGRLERFLLEAGYAGEESLPPLTGFDVNPDVPEELVYGDFPYGGWRCAVEEVTVHDDRPTEA